MQDNMVNPSSSSRCWSPSTAVTQPRDTNTFLQGTGTVQVWIFPLCKISYHYQNFFLHGFSYPQFGELHILFLHILENALFLNPRGFSRNEKTSAFISKKNDFFILPICDVSLGIVWIFIFALVKAVHTLHSTFFFQRIIPVSFKAKLLSKCYSMLGRSWLGRIRRMSFQSWSFLAWSFQAWPFLAQSVPRLPNLILTILKLFYKCFDTGSKQAVLFVKTKVQLFLLSGVNCTSTGIRCDIPAFHSVGPNLWSTRNSPMPVRPDVIGDC
jgi:hypothetical protein